MPAFVVPAVAALESKYMFKQHGNTILFKQQGNSQPFMAGQLKIMQDHATTAHHAGKMKMNCHAILRQPAILVGPDSQSRMQSRLHEVCHLTMHNAVVSSGKAPVATLATMIASCRHRTGITKAI